MQYGILVIGDEILSGRRKDRHLEKAIELLAARGERPSWAQYIGDDPSLIESRLHESMQSDAVVFSFGGIGATPDDLTRQCAATAAGVPLVRHPEARAIIEEKFGEEAYPKRILMADLPEGCTLIPNPYNRIPGFSIGNHHFLPGFPVMAHPMMAWVLETHYPVAPGNSYVEQEIYVHDVPESELIDLMQKIIDAHPQTRLFSLPLHSDEGIRKIELGLKGELALVEKAMREMLGELEHLGMRWTKER
ncbi:MAG: molybdopterin-binding protein [Sedimenticolaceae bacterium]|nr:molybdopterin-binding protein [Sedimenticolaceae bacterium]